MKANELRIGNIVNRQGTEIRVDGSDIKWFEDGSYLGIEPIPLTEEWFVRFGFNKANEYYKKQCNDFVLGIRIEDFFMPYISHTKLIHVHQLQNLYFALTGEELEIKNPG